CVPTSPSCALVDCADGYHCEEQCSGSTNDPNTMTTCSAVCVQDLSCTAVLCAPDTTCVEVCELDANGQYTCHPACVPTGDPGTCDPALCDSIPPACPLGTTPGTRN